MFKFKEIFLMLCLGLSGALCHAHVEVRMEIENNCSEDGIPIEVKECTGVSSSDKGNSINPTIDGNTLTIVFTESLGRVSVIVTTATGSLVDGTTTITPTGIQIYIPNTGDYVVNFTLPNGDEYYGEFSVTD